MSYNGTDGRVESMRTLDQVDLSDKDRRAVQAAARLLKQRFPIDQVILYGSKARGDAGPESDIDLLALTNRPVDWRERWRVYDALYELMLAEDVVIGVMVEHDAEWRARGPWLPLHRQVEQDGVLI